MLCYELFERDLDTMHQELSTQYRSAASNPAVATYTGSSSRSINNRFIGKNRFWGRRRDQRTTAELLDLIQRSPPLQKPLVVYSNTGTWNPLADIQQATLTTKPFTSTTLDYGFVFRFGAAQPNQAHVILQFDLPVGFHRGVYVGHAETASANQKEYILAPNQQWKVLGTKQVEQGGTQWTLVELTPG